MTFALLARVGAGFQKLYTTVIAGTPANAGNIPQLGADGYLDNSTIHPSLVPAPIALPAAVAIPAGSQVNIFNNNGTESVQLADATTTPPLRSDGYVTAAVAKNATASVYRRGGINTGVTGLTQGSDYFLGAAGAATVTQNTTVGQLDQYLGIATSGTTLDQLPPQVAVGN